MKRPPNFEEKIRELASQTWMEPNLGTFGKVLAAIEKRKRKRRILFFILFSILTGVIGVLSWWLQNPTISARQAQHASGLHHSFSFNWNEWEKSSLMPLQYTQQTDASNSLGHVIPNSTTNANMPTLKPNASQSNYSTNLLSERQHHDKQNTDIISIPDIETKETETMIADSSFSAITESFILEIQPDSFFNSSLQQADTNLISFPLSELRDTSTKKLQSFLDPNREKKWFVSASFTGFAVKSRFEENDISSPLSGASEPYAEYREYYDTYLFGFSVGTTIGYRPIKYFSIETGVSYTDFTSYEKPVGYPIQSTSPDAPADTFPIYIVTVDKHKTYPNRFQTIQFPLLFSGIWPLGKSAFHITAGPAFSYTTGFRGYQVEHTGGLSWVDKIESSQVQRFGVVLMGKLTYSYQILPNFSIYAGPAFQYRFNSLFGEKYIIRQKPYFVGAEAGLFVHF